MGKPLSIAFRHQLNFSTPNRTYPGEGVCFHPKNRIPYIQVCPYINTAPNIASNLMYTLEFQTQHHYPINLSPIAVMSKFKDRLLIIEQECELHKITVYRGMFHFVSYLFSLTVPSTEFLIVNKTILFFYVYFHLLKIADIIFYLANLIFIKFCSF